MENHKYYSYASVQENTHFPMFKYIKNYSILEYVFDITFEVGFIFIVFISVFIVFYPC